MVKRTQAVLAARKEAATQYAAYLTVRTYWNVLLMYFLGALLQQLCVRSWGRQLLLRYPELFSNGCARTLRLRIGFPLSGPFAAFRTPRVGAFAS